MVSAILFDFGGTLDSDGQHWLDRFYAIFDQLGIPNISKAQIKEAFYWADGLMEKDLSVRKAGFRQMMERHAHYQFEKLGIKDSAKESEAAALFYRPCERILHRNRGILEGLHQAGYKLGVVSNFYGNVDVLCEEAGIKGFLDVILDSVVVGYGKPDLRIFQLALDKLSLPAAEVAFVGDNIQRDILPAKAKGMKTVWLASDKTFRPPDFKEADCMIYSLEDLPRELKSKSEWVPA
jgi:HAD superfamily hydrolase (TIGR01509 family)